MVDSARSGFTVVALGRPDFLAACRDARLPLELARLAKSAGDNNPFYEHWMLVPAAQLMDLQSELLIVLVRDGDGELRAIFPFEVLPRGLMHSLSVLRLWRHAYAFLCTPLIDSRCVQETADALRGWLRSAAAPAPVLELHSYASDGTFGTSFLDALIANGQWADDSQPRSRAFLSRGGATSPAVSGRHLKELRRLTRRLRDRGSLLFRELQPADEAAEWLDRFLALEACGWKGRSGSAIASTPQHCAWFRTVMIAARAQDRLHMLALELDGRPVAMKCNLLSAPGSFAFKIAYSEEYGSFSPGVLLELFNMQALFESRPEISWMDSCADPGNAMIERLWPQRRPLAWRRLATRGRAARTLVGLGAPYRSMKQRLRGSAGRHGVTA